MILLLHVMTPNQILNKQTVLFRLAHSLSCCVIIVWHFCKIPALADAYGLYLSILSLCYMYVACALDVLMIVNFTKCARQLVYIRQCIDLIRDRLQDFKNSSLVSFLSWITKLFFFLSLANADIRVKVLSHEYQWESYDERVCSPLTKWFGSCESKILN